MSCELSTVKTCLANNNYQKSNTRNSAPRFRGLTTVQTLVHGLSKTELVATSAIRLSDKSYRPF